MRCVLWMFLFYWSIYSFAEEKNKITFFNQTALGYWKNDMPETNSCMIGALRKYFVPFTFNKDFIVQQKIKKMTILNYHSRYNNKIKRTDTLSVNKYVMHYDRKGNLINDYSVDCKMRNDSVIGTDTLFKRVLFYAENKISKIISHDFTRQPGINEYDSSYESVRFDTSTILYFKNKTIQTKQFYGNGYGGKRYGRIADTIINNYKNDKVDSYIFKGFNGNSYKYNYIYKDGNLSGIYSEHNNTNDTLNLFRYNGQGFLDTAYYIDKERYLSNKHIYTYENGNISEVNFNGQYGGEKFIYSYDKNGFLLKVYCNNPVVDNICYPSTGNYRYFSYEFY